MTTKRLGGLTAVALLGALALTACGSDNNTTAGSGSSSSSGSSKCGSGTLNAEGSTAQKDAIEEAISSFGDSCPDATINYNPTGSGAGVQNFNSGQVDFAGSDSALDPTKGEDAAAQKRCSGNPAWNIPMVAGPIAVSYNVDGVDGVVLTPSVLAKIFTGKITTWNDPAIAKLNSGAKLPGTAIKVFYRSDESGTTQNFEKYLAGAAASDWKITPDKAFGGGVGEGRQKSDGVANAIKTTPGAIGYIEWSYAQANKLAIAKVDNGGGAVELTGDTAGKAVAAAQPAGSGNDLKLKIDYTVKDPGTYPIVLVTYEIVCSKGLDANRTALEKAFLTHFSSTDFQSKLTSLGYAPLPSAVQTKVATAVQAIS